MIYLDNAATGFPKPPSVYRTARLAAALPLGNPGRSGHALARRSDGILFSARESLARMFRTDPERIIFTGGATAALNLAVRGAAAALFRTAPVETVATVYEHNSVLRPLYDLEKEGKIRLRLYAPGKENTPEAFFSFLPKGAGLCVLTAMSNVTGFTLPLPAIAEELNRRGVFLIADAAQAAGVMPVDFDHLPADLICAPAHKGLQGIMGAGVIAVSPKAKRLPEPVFSGGSGIAPFERDMPRLLPERLEAGTPPLPAIAALKAGADFLFRRGVEEIAEKEAALKKRLAEGLSVLPGFTLYGAEYPLGPLSFRRKGEDVNETADALEKSGVLCRAGIHCAPLAHRHLGTAPHGTVRLSVGALTAPREIEAALRALARL